MYKKQSGFTLVEISIVLLIVAIILGYTMAMVPVQQELKQYKQADDEMNDIIDSLYAFAQVNGYLPCPATSISNGMECRRLSFPGTCGGTTADVCDQWFGFVPGKTLGIDGKYSVGGSLLDPWGYAYRYQVSDANYNVLPATVDEDFVTPGEMNLVTMSNLSPDLVVCNQDPSPGAAGLDLACTNASETSVDGVPVVILSTGKDKSDNSASFSWIQRENLDNSVNDIVFVKTTMDKTSGSEFDDLVKWISPNVLYSKMLESGQLQ